MQAFGPAVDLSGEKFVHAEQIENRVGDSQCASELSRPARECDALFAFLMNLNGYIGRTFGFMSFYLNVFFFEWLEITRSRETRNTGFERIFVQRPTFI